MQNINGILMGFCLKSLLHSSVLLCSERQCMDMTGHLSRALHDQIIIRACYCFHSKVKLQYCGSLKRKTWQPKNKTNLMQATYNWTSSSGGIFACFSCTKKNNIWLFFLCFLIKVIELFCKKEKHFHCKRDKEKLK